MSACEFEMSASPMHDSVVVTGWFGGQIWKGGAREDSSLV